MKRSITCLMARSSIIAQSQIEPIDQRRADTVMLFTEMILRLVYEYPNEADKIRSAKTPAR
jgi:hypothetical protein